MTFSYVCRECPGMDPCLGEFYAPTEDELLQHMDMHARVAHQEDPSAWPADVSAAVKGLIRSNRPSPTTAARHSRCSARPARRPAQPLAL